MEIFKTAGAFFAILGIVSGFFGIMFIIARWMKNELSKDIKTSMIWSRTVAKAAKTPKPLKVNAVHR
jgi:hypothetical protein